MQERESIGEQGSINGLHEIIVGPCLETGDFIMNSSALSQTGNRHVLVVRLLSHVTEPIQRIAIRHIEFEQQDRRSMTQEMGGSLGKPDCFLHVKRRS